MSMVNKNPKSKIKLTYLLLSLGFVSLVFVVAGVTFSKILFTKTTSQASQIEGLHEVTRARESVDPLVTLAGRTPKVNQGDPILGEEDAKVTILSYGSFDCGYCGITDEILKELIKLYPQEVRVVWKDAPEDSQGESYLAAIAARCAQNQGKFWEMHSLLFKNQFAFTAENFSNLASQLSLDIEKFNRCVDNKETASYVDAAIEEAGVLEITQVPYFFVNDLEFVGLGTLADFQVVVDYLLKGDSQE